MPQAASAIIRGPIFEVLQKRQCKILFSIEGQDGGEKWLSLFFEDVEAFKCTYLTSMGSLQSDLRLQAYEAVISVSESPWLTEVTHSYTGYCATAQLPPKNLQHLMIAFDDGPCFEIICSGFNTSESPNK